MNFTRISALTLILACVVGFSVSAWAATSEVLNFGIISTESTQNLKSRWIPFLQRMEEETGLVIKPFFAPDYAGIISGMQYNKVQVAWLGNKAAISAVDRANAEIFVQTMDEAGIGGYYSHLIVHQDSPHTSLEDVLKNAKNLTFSNGDPNSTSGFLVPWYYIFSKNNIDPKTAFKRTVNANHETNALSVANKQVDVATISSEGLMRLESTQPAKRAMLKVVWTSPLIPSDPLVWRTDLPQDVKEKLNNFFLTFGVSGANAESDRAILKSMTWGTFRPSSNEQLIPFRELKLFKERGQIAANTNLSDAEKQAQLAKIDNELKKLNQLTESVKK